MERPATWGRRLAGICCVMVVALVVTTAPRGGASAAGQPSGARSDDFAVRSVHHYGLETAGLDAGIHTLLDARHADALLAVQARGVPVRLIAAASAYRDPAHAPHAWHLDRLHAAGVQIRQRRQAGPLHETLTVLHGQGMVALGSGGWLASIAEPAAALGSFSTRPWMYAAAVDRFARMWHNAAGVEETVPFTPLPPDVPAPSAPADGAIDQPRRVTLQWVSGPWAHRHDVLVGTSPGLLLPVARGVAREPARLTAEASRWVLTDLAPETTYYWQVVSRTMAGVEQAGPVSSFRTALASEGETRRAIARTPIGRAPATTLDAGATTPAGTSVVGTSGLEAPPPRRRPVDDASGTGRIALPRDAVEPGVGVGPSPESGAPGGGSSQTPGSPDVDGGAAGGTDGAGLPPPGYPGREADASWRQQALERIERIRKSDMHLRVVDEAGDPIPGAEVRLQMRRHQFGFGSAVTAFDLTSGTADGQRYRDVVERSFNRVVLENDLKWRNWIATGHWFYDRQRTFAALDWLQERQIQVRGHYVAWGRLTGDARVDRYAALGADEFRASLLRDANEIVTAIGTRVAEWDVVNHSNGRSEGTLLDWLGTDFYDRVFDAVADWQPTVRRYINEGDVLSGTRINRDRYYELIQGMLARGAPLQGIGMMGHFFSDAELVSPVELLQVFDRYASFGLPLQVTEFDFWTRNESLQADFTRDFLIAAFSHPAVEGVVMWGFWEGRHWHPAAALYRKDWTPKPNGVAWEDLVLGQWWTTAAGVTTASGTYHTRGFHGTYDLEVEHGSRLVSCRLDLGPGTTDAVLTLPANAASLPSASSARGEMVCRPQLPSPPGR